VKSGVVDRVRAAGGEVYAITSEPQRLADDARTDWALDFETVGDPHQEITAACRERGWLDIIVNTNTDLQAANPEANFSHPKGYYQPGVLALDRSGRVLYRWRGVPTRKNIGGATERPEAGYVMGRVADALAGTAADTRGDAALDRAPKLDSRGIPWPIFVSLLLANGWFVRPRPFTHIPGGPGVPRRLLLAAARIPVFIAAWIAAFAVLPSPLVAVALAGWAASITPGIRRINEQFQNVKDA